MGYLDHDAAKHFLGDRHRELISQSTLADQLMKVEYPQELRFSNRLITEMLALLRSRLAINWDQKGLNVANCQSIWKYISRLPGDSRMPVMLNLGDILAK